MTQSNELTASPLTPEEEAVLQTRVLALLQKQAQRYTGGESTSLPEETMRELLDSVWLTLGVDPQGDPALLRALLASDLDERLRQGREALEKKAESARRFWQVAYRTVPAVGSRALRDTLKSIGAGLRRYDPLLFAQALPCDIDYPLCHPVSEEKLGLDYVTTYLHRILIENDFLRHFDPMRTHRLLKSISPQYAELLVNLYEPVAANAIGLTIAGADPTHLNMTQLQREQIAERLLSLPGTERRKLLASSADELGKTLGIRDLTARAYLRTLASDLAPRLSVATDAAGIEGVFRSFSTPGIEALGLPQ